MGTKNRPGQYDCFAKAEPDEPGTTAVPLRNRAGTIVAAALIDEEDADRVHALGRWHLTANGYVRHSFSVGFILLHRFVLGLPQARRPEVDHANRDPLDNRRSNLRLATTAQNQQNVTAQRGSRSQYRNVTWDKGNRRWRVAIRMDGHTHNLGSFIDEDEAGRVAALWRAEHQPFSPEGTR